MKKILNIAVYISLLVFSLLFTSCSQDEQPVAANDNLEFALAESPFPTELIVRTVSNDGSYDNIVDGSSCFDINFPYTVSVNGVQITITTEIELDGIEEIFDALEIDEDKLDIVFPVTVVFEDYTELVVENDSELQELSKNCIEGGDDYDIECVDLVYPLTIFTYDPNFQQTGSVNVTNDRDMRRFFAGTDETDVISIQFPISLEMFDDTQVTVNSNEELAAEIQNVVNACDEDDDSDYNDDDFTKESLENALVKCPWLVQELKRNNPYDVREYINYKLVFNENGTVFLNDRAGNISSGEWFTSVIDYRVWLSVEFDDQIDFSLEWMVYEIDNDRIKFFANNDEDKIIVKQICDPNAYVCEDEFIIETLSNCSWVLSNMNSSSDGIFIFDFADMNIDVNNANEESQDQGNWTIYNGVITFNALSADFANYIGDWTITECSSERILMNRGDESLSFEKLCK